MNRQSNDFSDQEEKRDARKEWIINYGFAGALALAPFVYLLFKMYRGAESLDIESFIQRAAISLIVFCSASTFIQVTTKNKNFLTSIIKKLDIILQKWEDQDQEIHSLTRDEWIVRRTKAVQNNSDNELSSNEVFATSHNSLIHRLDLSDTSGVAVSNQEYYRAMADKIIDDQGIRFHLLVYYESENEKDYEDFKQYFSNRIAILKKQQEIKRPDALVSGREFVVKRLKNNLLKDILVFGDHVFIEIREDMKSGKRHYIHARGKNVAQHYRAWVRSIFYSDTDMPDKSLVEEISEELDEILQELCPK